MKNFLRIWLILLVVFGLAAAAQGDIQSDMHKKRAVAAYRSQHSGGPSGPALLTEAGGYVLNENGSYLLQE